MATESKQDVVEASDIMLKASSHNLSPEEEEKSLMSFYKQGNPGQLYGSDVELYYAIKADMVMAGKEQPMSEEERLACLHSNDPISLKSFTVNDSINKHNRATSQWDVNVLPSEDMVEVKDNFKYLLQITFLRKEYYKLKILLSMYAIMISAQRSFYSFFSNKRDTISFFQIRHQPVFKCWSTLGGQFSGLIRFDVSDILVKTGMPKYIMVSQNSNISIPYWDHQLSTFKNLQVNQSLVKELNTILTNTQQTLYDLIIEPLEKYKKSDIIFTGFGRHASLSQLVSMIWKNQDPEKTHLITFGLPRLGNETYQNLSKDRTHHICVQDEWDPRCHLPSGLPPHQAETLIYIGKNRIPQFPFTDSYLFSTEQTLDYYIMRVFQEIGKICPN